MTARSIRFGGALKQGFSLARRSWGVMGLALLAEVSADLLSLGAGLSLGAMLIASLERAVLGQLSSPPVAAGTALHQLARGLVPWAGAWLVATLVALLLRLLWFTAGARTFSMKLSGESAPGALPAASSRLRRGLVVALLFAPIELAVMLYNLTALGSTGLLWANALELKRWGLAASASLAFAIALSLALQLATDLVLRLSLLRAVAADVGPLDALTGALGLLGSRLGLLAGVTALFALLGWVASTIAGSGGVIALGSGAAAVALGLGIRIATGVAGSALNAFLSTAELGALCAIDAAARGLLPEPAQPPPAVPAPLPTEPVLESEVVLETRLVEAPQTEK